MSKILALVLLLAGLSGAQAQVAMTGNDIGGIISWSPESQRVAASVAAAHCAYFGKVSRITSVHRQYGDYIGFECAFPRGYYLRTRQVAIRAKG